MVMAKNSHGWSRRAILASLLALLCMPGIAAEPKRHFDPRENLYNQAPPNEVAALPRYCWGKYDGRFKGPRYQIPRDRCGGGHNHFCQGILRFYRSQHPMATSREKKWYLNVAIENFEYTAHNLRKFPQCPIRRDVQTILRRAVTLRAGMPPPPPGQ
jgi:hypothetical protein